MKTGWGGGKEMDQREACLKLCSVQILSSGKGILIKGRQQTIKQSQNPSLPPKEKSPFFCLTLHSETIE